jgi:hypothetical protein
MSSFQKLQGLLVFRLWCSGCARTLTISARNTVKLSNVSCFLSTSSSFPKRSSQYRLKLRLWSLSSTNWEIIFSFALFNLPDSHLNIEFVMKTAFPSPDQNSASRIRSWPSTQIFGQVSPCRERCAVITSKRKTRRARRRRYTVE